MSLRIPSRPAAWPFPLRDGEPTWTERNGERLGSLGEGWRLVVPATLELPTAESDLPGSFGRGGVRRLGGLVLRPYRRGGLLRHLNRSAYASPRRFEREWIIHRALWEAGFPTVQPMGYACRRRGLRFEGVYLTNYAEALPWPADWSAGANRLEEIGRALRALDGWGLWAPDLNATNILVEPAGLLFLDWDRSAFVAPGSLLILYRRRLLRSLAKLGAPAALQEGVLAALKEEGRGGR